MEIRDSERVPYFLFYTFTKRKKIMKEKNQVVPDEVLSKEFFSQFKTEADGMQSTICFQGVAWQGKSVA